VILVMKALAQMCVYLWA